MNYKVISKLESFECNGINFSNAIQTDLVSIGVETISRRENLFDAFLNEDLKLFLNGSHVSNPMKVVSRYIQYRINGQTCSTCPELFQDLQS